MTLPVEYEIDILQRRCAYIEQRELRILDMLQNIVNIMQDLKFLQMDSDAKIKIIERKLEDVLMQVESK